MSIDNVFKKHEKFKRKGFDILPIYFISPLNAKKLCKDDFLNWFNYQIDVRSKMNFRELTDEEKEIYGCNLYKKII